MLPKWDEIFRGYDIRGRFPGQINPSVAFVLGTAIGVGFPGPYMVGRDPRRESGTIESALIAGLERAGCSAAPVGILPTPGVAFLGRDEQAYGLSVTPSHNPLGYAGVKAFGTEGVVFDSEWEVVGKLYERLRLQEPGPSPMKLRRLPTKRAARPVGWMERYLHHLTANRTCSRRIVLDCRGGATAVVAPRALRTMGARVTEVSRGYSPTFFGKSPEPTFEDLAEIASRIASETADIGFAFDGDGDRCVVVDAGGKVTPPEAIALLLHRIASRPDRPLVASVDTAHVLEQRVPTVRSRVGSRYISRAMRRAGADVGVELSGHYYVRREGPDSDGVLVACLVAHALSAEPGVLGDCVNAIGELHRGALSLEFNSSSLARLTFRKWARERGLAVSQGEAGVTLHLESGWCLVRASNTQPLIRFTFEANTAQALRRLRREVTGLRKTMAMIGLTSKTNEAHIDIR